jgi:hypothetical protein
VLQDSVSDHAGVPACPQKLHDFRAFPGHFCPTGFGLRILFQAAKVNAIHLKINLCQAMFARSANGEGRSADRYDFLLFHERLAPHRDECVIESGGGVGSSHMNRILPDGIFIRERFARRRDLKFWFLANDSSVSLLAKFLNELLKHIYLGF